MKKIKWGWYKKAKWYTKNAGKDKDKDKEEDDDRGYMQQGRGKSDDYS